MLLSRENTAVKWRYDCTATFARQVFLLLQQEEEGKTTVQDLGTPSAILLSTGKLFFFSFFFLFEDEFLFPSVFLHSAYRQLTVGFP